MISGMTLCSVKWPHLTPDRPDLYKIRYRLANSNQEFSTETVSAMSSAVTLKNVPSDKMYEIHVAGVTVVGRG